MFEDINMWRAAQSLSNKDLVSIYQESTYSYRVQGSEVFTETDYFLFLFHYGPTMSYF